jgi:hypothetical protein
MQWQTVAEAKLKTRPSARGAGNTIFIELMATHSVLEKWKWNPLASKLEIGIWSHWCEPTEKTACCQRKRWG